MNLRMVKKVWLISVNMGYGHQRTAYPLRDIAFDGKIINANDYQGIPQQDRKIWETARRFYEFISRFRRIPLIGKAVFSIYDRFQKILNFYPRRDLSKPNFSLKQTYNLFRNGWGKNLISKLKQKPISLVTTFFIPAFMAEFFHYPGEIFCIICDTDISRTWAPLNPKKSKIKYFAPNKRVVERLKLYGVKPKNIFLTGYPLPLKNIDGKNMETLKKDLKYRLLNLDPQKEYFERYKILVEGKLGKMPQKNNHILTIIFAVGGAGAQKEVGIKIVESLTKKIKANEIKIILVAGIKEKVKNFFLEKIRELNLENNKNIEIIYDFSIENYFKKFNQKLKKTDILWTKPSELSFYTALGLPIIIAPPIGSQEHFNKSWLFKSGFGSPQKNPRDTEQWLFDWIKHGYLAEAAMQGFIEGEKLGTLRIKNIILK